MNYFVLIVFVLLPLIGVVGVVRKWTLIRHGVRATAKIVGIEKSEPGLGAETIHYPVVEFRDHNRRSVRITMWAEPPDNEHVQIGDTVRLIYPRNRPAGASYDNRIALFLLPALCFIPALTFIVFIAGAVVWHKLFG